MEVLKKDLINFKIFFNRPEQKVKRYPSGVLLDNQKLFLFTLGPKTKYFERFYIY